ncbi:MATE_efflux family protein [Hexamita inflata]|uniref:MATE efflux family protein n=1 Tax=Hexamita inflata TaxID=28002 RepID=A0AA86TDI0_9EUKA|nr:MATE efflux family protein [Hexamita inflata]
MSAGIASLLKCQNKATLAMARQIIGAALNLGLDALFMIPLKMQIKGAALATIISYALTGVWIVIYLFTKKATLKMTRESFKINPKTIWQIYVIGSSTYANFIPGSLSSLLSSVLLRAFSQNLDEARRLQISVRYLELRQQQQHFIYCILRYLVLQTWEFCDLNDFMFYLECYFGELFLYNFNKYNLVNMKQFLVQIPNTNHKLALLFELWTKLKQIFVRNILLFILITFINDDYSI